MAESTSVVDQYSDAITSLNDQAMIGVGVGYILVMLFVVGVIGHRRRWHGDEWGWPVTWAIGTGILWPLIIPAVLALLGLFATIFTCMGAVNLGRLASGWKPAPRIREYD